MKPKTLLLWAIALALSISLIYSALFSATSLGVSFFTMIQRGMVHYAVSSVLFSANVDLAVFSAAVLFAVTGLLVGSRLNKGKSGKLQIFLALVPIFFVPLAFLASNVFFLALASIWLVLVTAGFSGSYFGVSTFSFVKRLVLGVALILLLVEVAGFASFLLSATPLKAGLGSAVFAGAQHWVLVELSFSNLFYPLLPWAFLLFVLLGVAGLFVKLDDTKKVLMKLKIFAGLFGFFRRVKSKASATEELSFDSAGWRIVLLSVLISIVVSALLVAVTVAPWVNPTNRLVSVDAPSYYTWLSQMRSTDFGSAMQLAFANDRSTLMVGMYALSSVVAPVDLLQFLPLLLIPAFSTVCVLLMWRLNAPKEAVVLAGFIVPLSFQGLGLIYSGYFANMLALIFVFAYFALFLWVLDKKSLFGVVGLVGLSVLALFSHPWTWLVFALSLVFFLFVEWRSSVGKQGFGLRLKWMLTLVSSSIAVSLLLDFARRLLTASSVGFSTSIGTAGELFALPSLKLLSGLNITANFYLGGAFANQLLIALAIMGFVLLLSRKSEVSSIFVSWVFVASVSILFAGSEYAYNRLLFLVPFGLFSSLGLSYLLQLGKSDVHGSRFPHLKSALVFVTLVFLMLLLNGLRFASNINMV